MSEQDVQDTDSLEVRRKIAERFGCVPREDWQAVSGYTDGTIDDMSRRRKGPLPMRIGKFWYYAVDDIKAQMLSTKRTNVETTQGVV